MVTVFFVTSLMFTCNTLPTAGYWSFSIYVSKYNFTFTLYSIFYSIDIVLCFSYSKMQLNFYVLKS